MLNVKKIRIPSSLSERAYESIKESILKIDVTKVKDEERIDERGLSESLGISRTPLREAINRLVIEGFLKVVPRKGVYVVKKSKKEIIEILLVRAVLEGMAARLATKNVTEDEIQKMKELFSPFGESSSGGQFIKYSDANIVFHELVLRTSQCDKLIELAGNIFDHIRWIRFRTIVYEDRFPKMQKEHLHIIEAFEKRNPDLAERRMRAHIEGLAQYIEEKIHFAS
ncbi:MAG: GntR family transcriptional regulator [Desulfobacteraceae bacterium]|jgi:DNA-binding GntR family transcriptional regulator|nr:MAG: GntR family transcriptional regulator [Desulfobacteraceae bacterium]